MHWYDRLTEIGGVSGSIIAYLLNIELGHVLEIAFYAFIGAAVGEAVKEAVKLYNKKRSKKDGQ